jgi:hypothetical protein
MKALAAVLVLIGCVDQGPGPSKKVDPSLVAVHLVKQVPAGVTALNVDLGDGVGKVVYVGNTVEGLTPWAPGATLTFKSYWKVIQPPGPNWRVFAMVKGSPNTADFVNVAPSEVEQGHPVKDWKAGEIIEDVQAITLRPDWRSKTATLVVGLIAVGEHDVGDRMRAVGPNTVDRAIIARQIEVDLSKAPPPPGTVYVPRASGPIAIDGIANEPSWQTAVSSPEFATAEGCSESVGKATAKLTYDDTNLYVWVSITDTDVYSEFKKHDDPVWKQDSVEIFIDADGNKRGYVELQVNPNNVTFDSWFAGGRAPSGEVPWDSNMLTAVKVRGTPDVANDTDQGWDVEIAIPLEAVKGRDAAMPINLPPQIGDRWKMNVVRVDRKSGAKDVAASSWNRITCADFHGLDRMLTVVFADPSGSIVKKPDPIVIPSSDGSGSAVAPVAPMPVIAVPMKP